MIKSAQSEEKYRGVEPFYGLRTNFGNKKNFPAVPMELSLGGGTAGEYQPYPLGKYF